MFSVQLLAQFFSNSDKLIVPAQQTLLRVDLATNMFKYRDCDDDVFQWVMGFFHHFVDTVQLAVVELVGLVGMVVHLVGTFGGRVSLRGGENETRRKCTSSKWRHWGVQGKPCGD